MDFLIEMVKSVVGGTLQYPSSVICHDGVPESESTIELGVRTFTATCCAHTHTYRAISKVPQRHLAQLYHYLLYFV